MSAIFPETLLVYPRSARTKQAVRFQIQFSLSNGKSIRHSAKCWRKQQIFPRRAHSKFAAPSRRQEMCSARVQFSRPSVTPAPTLAGDKSSRRQELCRDRKSPQLALASQRAVAYANEFGLDCFLTASPLRLCLDGCSES